MSAKSAKTDHKASKAVKSSSKSHSKPSKVRVRVRVRVPTRRHALPNIVVTGTPGVGKTHISRILASELGLHHVNVSDHVHAAAASPGPRPSWLGPYNPALDTHEISDRGCAELVRTLLDRVPGGRGAALDWHSAECWPREAVDLVVVLRARTDTIYDRLKARGYSQAKIDEDISCEIFGEVSRRVKRHFRGVKIIEMDCNDENEAEKVLEQVGKWIKEWTHRPAATKTGRKEQESEEEESQSEEEEEEEESEDSYYSDENSDEVMMKLFKK